MKKRKLRSKKKGLQAHSKKKEFKKAYSILLIVFVFLGIFLLYEFYPRVPYKRIVRGTPLKILSPLNKTYDTNNIIVHVVSSRDVAWINHSIDGEENISVCNSCNSYKINSSNFDKGTHTITVYAGDFENGESKTSVVFTVA